MDTTQQGAQQTQQEGPGRGPCELPPSAFEKDQAGRTQGSLRCPGLGVLQARCRGHWWDLAVDRVSDGGSALNCSSGLAGVPSPAGDTLWDSTEAGGAGRSQASLRS